MGYDPCECNAQQYRKRPVVIEAVRLTEDNIEAVADWIMATYVETGQYDKSVSATLANPDAHLLIETLEGDMRANPGDWVIRGVADEFYPCQHAIFDASYEQVEPDVDH